MRRIPSTLVLSVVPQRPRDDLTTNRAMEAEEGQHPLSGRLYS